MSANHQACKIGEFLPADYFSPGASVINGQPYSSLWAEIPHGGEWLRFERNKIGDPWVRVERWIEFVGMPWDSNRLYRFRGRRVSGWPDEVEYYDEDLRQWEKAPNCNVHIKASHIQTDIKNQKL